MGVAGAQGACAREDQTERRGLLPLTEVSASAYARAASQQMGVGRSLPFALGVLAACHASSLAAAAVRSKQLMKKQRFGGKDAQKGWRRFASRLPLMSVQSEDSRPV